MFKLSVQIFNVCNIGSPISRYKLKTYINILRVICKIYESISELTNQLLLSKIPETGKVTTFTQFIYFAFEFQNIYQNGHRYLRVLSRNLWFTTLPTNNFFDREVCTYVTLVAMLWSLVTISRTPLTPYYRKWSTKLSSAWILRHAYGGFCAYTSGE